MKRIILATLVVFVIWVIIDLVIHGIVLNPVYDASREIWRSEASYRVYIMYLARLFAAFSFVLVYALFFGKRGVGTGLWYGFLLGFAAGFTLGYGTFAMIPIPSIVALTWFLVTLFEGVVAGAIIGGMFPVGPWRGVTSPAE
ncbi:MAG: hypothetical protein ACOC0U_02505 [Desulfovibrionales bacterium]